MDSINTPAQITEQQPTIVQPDAPWLLMNGNITPEEHLKTLTPSWNAETWEKYLIWFEDLTGQRAESLVPSRRYDEECERQEESIFVFAQSNADDELRNFVGHYLKKLTNQQRRVIELIFWEGRSERFIAKSLGISGIAVHQMKKRALKSLSQSLRGVSSSRIMRGEISPIRKGGTDEGNHQMAEVDLAEAG